jgi:uncharacterized protein YehS (DUF1456 family)
MIHNDILRRLRYALTLSNEKIQALFASVGYEVPVEHVVNIIKKEDDVGFILCRDSVLCLFLDALIIDRRGKKEGQTQYGLKPGEVLSNNDILRKLRIALELKEEDVLAILALADFRVSKSELSALFRKSDHRNYKECGDQLLRNFLLGLSRHYHGVTK